MVDPLTRGPASVSELAQPLEMSLAVVQHVQVLEASGLVRSRKVGRVRTCTIEPDTLRSAERWIAERRTSPGRVFAAFADPEQKAAWFAGPPEWPLAVFEVDFRVGDREINRGGPKGGKMHSFEALYFDIVPDQRIVYSYEMHLDVELEVAEVLDSPRATHIRYRRAPH